MIILVHIFYEYILLTIKSQVYASIFRRLNNMDWEIQVDQQLLEPVESRGCFVEDHPLKSPISQARSTGIRSATTIYGQPGRRLSRLSKIHVTACYSEIARNPSSCSFPHKISSEGSTRIVPSVNMIVGTLRLQWFTCRTNASACLL